MTDLAARLTASREPIVSDGADLGVVLVCFGGLQEKVGMPPVEFLRVTDGLQARRVFVRDPHRCFYQQGIPGAATWPDIVEQVRSHVDGADRVVLLGNSAGASAALIAATALRPQAVLAFSPVTFLDRRRRLQHLDRRWPDAVRRARQGPPAQRRYADVAAVLRGAAPTGAHVYFAAGMRLDAAHARRLPGVTLRPVAGRDHQVIRQLRDSGRLRGIIEAAVTGPHV